MSRSTTDMASDLHEYVGGNWWGSRVLRTLADSRGPGPRPIPSVAAVCPVGLFAQPEDGAWRGVTLAFVGRANRASEGRDFEEGSSDPLSEYLGSVCLW